jgi:hypothetical protein
MFWTHCVGPFDRGFGLQRALPLRHWTTGYSIKQVLDETDATAAPQNALVAPKAHPRVVQTDLFA